MAARNRTEPQRGSRWLVVESSGTVLAPIGTVAVVRRVEIDAVGYEYVGRGGQGVLPLREWDQRFAPGVAHDARTGQDGGE